jgi:hypothetical protein
MSDYYERIATEFSRRTGITIDAAFVEQSERISGKAFNEMAPEDFDRCSETVMAEAEAEVLQVIEAGELTRVVTASMQKRRAATTEELHTALCDATDADAAAELSALETLIKIVLEGDR